MSKRITGNLNVTSVSTNNLNVNTIIKSGNDISIPNYISSTISTLIVTNISSGSGFASIGNIVTTNQSVTNLLVTNLTYGFAQITNTNMTNTTISNLNSINITTTNLFGTNNTSTNIIGTNATISNLGATNITANLVTTNSQTVNNLLISGGGLRASWNSNTIGNIFTTAGNVGIDTTSPSEKLNVNGIILIDAEGLGQAQLKLSGGSGSTNRASRIDFYNKVISSSVPRWTIINDYDQDGKNDFRIVNDYGPSLCITSSGNVGIGTSSPSSKLFIQSDNSSASQVIIATSTNTNGQLLIGYHPDNYANIQSVEQNVAYRNLILQKFGGNVGIGRSDPIGGILDIAGDFRVSQGVASSNFLINLGSTGVGGFRSGYIAGDGTNIDILNQQNGFIRIGANNRELLRIADNSYEFFINTGSDIRLTSNNQINYFQSSRDLVYTLPYNSAPFAMITTNGNLYCYGNRLGKDLNIGSPHDSDKRNTLSIGRWDGEGVNKEFLGLDFIVDTASNIGAGSFDNQSAILFKTWGNTISANREVMRIDSRGHVGIGTTNPSQRLTLNNSIDNCYISLRGIESAQQGIEFYDTAQRWSIYKPVSSIDLRFYNGSSDILTLTNSGNIGIGTNNPGERLDVRGNLRVGSSNTSNYIAFHGTSNDGEGSYNHTYIGERLYGGTESSELLLFKGNDTPGGSGPDRIRLVAAEHRFDIYTDPFSPNAGTFSNIGTIGSAKMSIDQSGVIIIGNLSVSGSATILLDLTVRQVFEFSDERLKENIELADLDICYNVVKNLQLKRYRWKNTTYNNEGLLDRNIIGWIAQDVKEIFPKAVNQTEFTQIDGTKINDCLILNESMIIKSLYGCVQKLIGKIEEQKVELETTKEKLTTTEIELTQVLEKYNSLEQKYNNLEQFLQSKFPGEI